MTHPAVDFVLEKIKTQWSAGSFSDVPLQRIDGDNNDNLSNSVYDATDELREANLVDAKHTERDDSPVGTEYDLQIDGLTVSCTVAGLHVRHHGLIDPSASFPPANAEDSVPFYGLRRAIIDAIESERGFPDTASNIDYTDLTVTNRAPSSYEFADYYQYEFDVVFAGFEQL